MQRSEIVELVRMIRAAEYSSEEQRNEWLTLLEAIVPHPAVSDLIFFPERPMTDEEIVEIALGYSAIRL